MGRQFPLVYTPDIYQQKCEAVYQHVYETYFGAGQSIYSPGALQSQPQSFIGGGVGSRAAMVFVPEKQCPRIEKGVNAHSL
jgi:hypothetical protein